MTQEDVIDYWLKAADLLVINDLYEIDDLFMAYDNSGGWRRPECKRGE